MGEITLNKRIVSQVKTFALRKMNTDLNLKKAMISQKNDFTKETNVPSISNMLYDNVFDYRYIVNPEEEAGTIISMSVRLRNNSDQTNRGRLVFYIFTHKKLMRTGLGFNKNDFLVSELMQLFNDTKSNSVIKKMKFTGEEELSPIGSFVSHYVEFDFEVFDYDNDEYTEYKEDEEGDL